MHLYLQAIIMYYDKCNLAIGPLGYIVTLAKMPHRPALCYLLIACCSDVNVSQSWSTLASLGEKIFGACDAYTCPKEKIICLRRTHASTNSWVRLCFRVSLCWIVFMLLECPLTLRQTTANNWAADSALLVRSYFKENKYLMG